MVLSAQSFDSLTTSSLALTTSLPQANSVIPSSSTVSSSLIDPLKRTNLSASPSSAIQGIEKLSSANTSLITNGTIGSIASGLQAPTKYTGGSEIANILKISRYKADPTLDNTLAGAWDFGILQDWDSRSDSISGSDLIDYAHFHLNGTSSFNLHLHGETGDAVIALLDSTGNLLQTGIETKVNYNTHDVSLNIRSLAAGDYYLRVTPFYQRGDISPVPARFTLGQYVSTNYQLDIAVGVPSKLLPTDVDLGHLAETRLLTGAVNDTNTTETYRVVLDKPSTLNVTLSGLDANADVRLIRDTNTGIIGSSDVIAASTNGSWAPDGMNIAVGAGTYFVQVYQGPGAEGKSVHYNLGVSTGDWFTQNLSDFGIIADARLAAKNGTIDRNEMVNLLKDTEFGGVINQTKLNDLKTVLNSLGYMMPDYVSNLASKVINGDPANTRSNIGNLVAGSSATQMDRLIGKWFLGTDHPLAQTKDDKGKVTTYAYKPVAGKLFQNGISYLDVKQEDLGDCYFLASLAETDLRTPATIQNMFIDNGDNTWTVRFYHDGKADYVTVDNQLPTTSINADPGAAVFAGWGGGGSNNPANELWVALAEKAYAQMNESGVLGRDGKNSYQSLTDGFGRNALAHITGRPVENGHVTWGIFGQNDDIGKITSAWQQGQLVTLGTKNNDDVYSNVAKSHEYALVAYDGHDFTLFNPWGVDGGTGKDGFRPGFVTLTADGLKQNFANWSAATA